MARRPVRGGAELMCADTLATEIDGGGNVHVWCARLDLSPEAGEGLHALLSPDERLRAAAYPSAVQGTRFASTRGILRQLLEQVTGVPGRAIQFAYNRDGKPSLAGDLAALGVEFNVSHTRDLAVVAVTRGREVGIDIASTGGVAPIDNLVARFFSPEERVAVAKVAADGERQRELFTRIWVRKEAYLKGRGEGISQWVHLTDFSHSADHSATDCSATSTPSRPDRDQDAWDVRDLRGLPTGYVGSVALARRIE